MPAKNKSRNSNKTIIRYLVDLRGTARAEARGSVLLDCLRQRYNEFTIIALVCVVGFFAPCAYGGDIDPPSGPVGPTMRTLDQVEPRIPIVPSESVSEGSAAAVSIPIPDCPDYTIVTSGSYLLTKDCLGEAGKNGLTIDADNVTIDLDGYTMNGRGVGNTAFLVSGSHKNISIFNGTITGWGESAVDAGDASNSRLTDLRVTGYGSLVGTAVGLRLGSGAVITRCQVQTGGGGGDGIEVGNRSVVAHCQVAAPAVAGIRVGSSGTVSDCTVWGARNGIVAAENSVIRNCHVDFIVGVGLDPSGILVGNHCQVVGNMCITAFVLGGDGIVVTGVGNRIHGNNVVVNGTTIRGGIIVTGTGNLITANTVTRFAVFGPLPGVAYDIGPGNANGPIVNVAGGGTFGLSDPYANLEY